MVRWETKDGRGLGTPDAIDPVPDVISFDTMLIVSGSDYYGGNLRKGH